MSTDEKRTDRRSGNELHTGRGPEKKRYARDESDFRYSPDPGRPYGSSQEESATGDERLSDLVRKRLIETNPALATLTVTVDEGRVTLEGPVASTEERDAAVSVARLVGGVTAVADRMHVEHSATTHEDSEKHDGDDAWPPARVRRHDPFAHEGGMP